MALSSYLRATVLAIALSALTILPAHAATLPFCDPSAHRVSVQTGIGGTTPGLRWLVSRISVTDPQNAIEAIIVGSTRNARVLLNGTTPIESGQVYIPSTPTTAVQLIVQRVTFGQPVLVTMTVRDRCGEWPTFVGSGPNAL